MDSLLRVTSLEELEGAVLEGYSGVLFGVEFCPHLLPHPDDVAIARKKLRSLDMTLTLVTPLVREAHFDFVCEWLRRSIAEGEEWVANDWGLMKRMREEGLRNPVTAGRLLSRQRRGPRVLDMIEAADINQKRALRANIWGDPAILELGARLGMRGVEVDATLQGVEPFTMPKDFILTVCGPYIPVTLAIACPWNIEGATNPKRCHRPCRRHSPVIMENQENPSRIYAGSNAQFIKVEAAYVYRLAEALGAGWIAWSESMPL
ncbi:MAG: hypothetical protein C0608_02340 [Deltaproteobacteria bacterium]|nr:MAG: hypothetical protein C0608_02340 [Deltaproteobacteria bacterium]